MLGGPSREVSRHPLGVSPSIAVEQVQEGGPETDLQEVLEPLSGEGTPFQRFSEGCLELEAIARDHEIEVDLHCEE